MTLPTWADEESGNTSRGVTVVVLNQDGSRETMRFRRMSHGAAMLIAGCDWMASNYLPLGLHPFTGCEPSLVTIEPAPPAP